MKTVNNSQKFRLQQIVWPSAQIGGPGDLYFRATPPNAWRLQPDIGIRSVLEPIASLLNAIEFSTFYGAFSLSTWSGVSGLDEVIIDCECQGSGVINIWYENGVEPRLLIHSELIDCPKKNAISVSITGLKGKKGILYPEIIIDKPDFFLYGLNYSTTAPPLRKVKLAIVMPTFKREAYVKKNVALILAAIADDLADHVDIYIVDNAKSLNAAEFAGCHVIQNKNYGGSGGFARGVIEAIHSGIDYTNILFCDDDVLIEPEAIKRLYSLLRYIDADAIVPGGMLDMGNRGRLHEIGAVVHGLEFYGTKAGLDLQLASGVINYNISEFSTFYGWWFVCYPTSVLKTELPFPAFVGFDDVEFGIRLKGAEKVVVLNGISVWHDEFHKKEVNWRWYYHARNGLAIHYSYGQGLFIGFQLIKQILGALLTYRYEKAKLLMDGVDDALKGPHYLETLLADEFHLALSKSQQFVMKPVQPSSLSISKYSPYLVSSKFKKMLILLTLNGHLLPGFLMQNAKNPTQKGFAIEALHSNRLQAIFRKPTVLYYEPTVMQGILCHICRQHFFSGLLRLGFLSVQLFQRHTALTLAWKQAHSRLVSYEFWKKHLDLQ